MKEARTFAGVERVTPLINNQAKKLALFSILRAGPKHENV